MTGVSTLADPSLVLAIDQGTSATNAILVDAAGAVTARAAAPVRQHYPSPGRAEQDPAGIWSSVQRVVADVLSEVDPSRVAAVGLSTQSESTLLWDRGTGKPLGPVVGWQDNRGGPLCQTSELSALGVAHLAGHAAGLWSAADLDQLPRNEHMRNVTTTAAESRTAAARRWHNAVDTTRSLAALDDNPGPEPQCLNDRTSAPAKGTTA